MYRLVYRFPLCGGCTKLFTICICELNYSMRNSSRIRPDGTCQLATTRYDWSMSDTFEDALRRLIKASGMTPYELAKSANVAQSVLSRFLSGERGLNSATIGRLMDVLGLEIRAKRKRG